MNTTKPLIKSKTFIGAISVLIASIIGLVFGVEVTDASVMEIITQVVSLVGAIYAIYGRIVAKDEITSIM